MAIYTKTGDCGETSLIGGVRISKADPRLEAYGTLDELTAFEGELYNRLKDDRILWIIDRTMDCAALTASDGTSRKKLPQITDDMVSRLEKYIDTLTESLPPVTKFTLPVGSPSLSMCHICRTVCRRAERSLVGMGNADPGVICFINRLSDFFYALGRYTVYKEGIEEIYWEASRDNI